MTVLVNLILRILTYSFLATTGYFAINTGIVPLVSWLGIVGLWLYRSIVTIPVIHYGDYRVFGKRIGQTVPEGIHWREWWYTVRLYPAEIRSIRTRESFTSKDRVEITIDGYTQYNPDMELISERFAALSEDTIKDGLNSIIKEELGAIAGRYNYKTFVEKRMRISQLINCLLRMNHPPHLHIEALTWVENRAGNKPDLASIRNECKDAKGNSWLTADDEVLPERRIEFYEKFSYQIRLLLEREKGKKNVKSRVEKNYAIDIDHFNLADISWTEKFRDTMEKEQQAAVEVSAKRKKATAVRSLAKKIRTENPKMSEEAAFQNAMAAHGLTKHITIQGGGSTIPILNIGGDEE